ncbi:MAG: CBS domain-containing protein [Chloroflexi bacterium]|nr:CBS domain-containing protein [Chloroflexota bacterium]MCH8114168.1 CBS domain-containing protein [Chloroflexota bacterium]MCI0776359.1 CBS domain-containing protein [Chloroflexota bacterium]MCI0805056.1 CBS domain-containing protein [Chloroflexota bacterium]MCI0809609.1 CBS domain-containing protein [Chloroflexota bacterium]
MSPRAAWRLETLGFARVYDYVAGKKDWSAAGLPLEGETASMPRAGDAVRGGDVICRLDETLGQVQSRVKAADTNVCIVTTDDGIVLGRIRGRALRGDPESTAEQAMRPGPSTIRPDNNLAEVVAYYGESGLKTVLVTDQDGRLIGTLYIDDARSILNRQSAGSQN